MFARILAFISVALHHPAVELINTINICIQIHDRSLLREDCNRFSFKQNLNWWLTMIYLNVPKWALSLHWYQSCCASLIGGATNSKKKASMFSGQPTSHAFHPSTMKPSSGNGKFPVMNQEFIQLSNFQTASWIRSCGFIIIVAN